MGAYLSTPSKHKAVSRGEDERVRYGTAAMQGWRVSMEDAHVVELNLDQDTAFFAVFDGHGGSEVAKFCATHLSGAVKASPAFADGDVATALQQSFMKMDMQLLATESKAELARYSESDTEAKEITEQLQHQVRTALFARAGFVGEAAMQLEQALEPPCLVGIDGDGRQVQAPAAGTTSIVAVLTGNALVVANAGDSRCVLCRRGVAEEMSKDHKPTTPEERQRILRAGGFVADGRVNGSLALSRAIGDFEFKTAPGISPSEQAVTALPEVRSATLGGGDEFMVLACDGIWDVMTSQQCVDFVRQRLAAGMPPSDVCCELCDACCAEDTGGSGLGCDNMSVILVVFKEDALDKDSPTGRVMRPRRFSSR